MYHPPPAVHYTDTERDVSKFAGGLFKVQGLAIVRGRIELPKSPTERTQPRSGGETTNGLSYPLIFEREDGNGYFFVCPFCEI